MKNSIATITPYAAAKIVNQALADNGIQSRIPSQMMYNYSSARVNKGKTPYIETLEGRIVVTSLNEWIVKYISKKLGTSAVTEVVEYNI